MEFFYKYRRLIVIALASVMILLGVFQMLTGIVIDRSVMDGVEYVIMFGALYLLLILPKQYERTQQKNVVTEDEEDSENVLDEENVTTQEVEK